MLRQSFLMVLWSIVVDLRTVNVRDRSVLVYFDQSVLLLVFFNISCWCFVTDHCSWVYYLYLLMLCDWSLFDALWPGIIFLIDRHLRSVASQCHIDLSGLRVRSGRRKNDVLLVNVLYQTVVEKRNSGCQPWFRDPSRILGDTSFMEGVDSVRIAAFSSGSHYHHHHHIIIIILLYYYYYYYCWIILRLLLFVG